MIINYAKEMKDNQFWLVEYLINWSYIEHLKLAAFPMHQVGGRIKEGYIKALLSRGKVVLVHAIKAYIGSSGTALLILSLGVR